MGGPPNLPSYQGMGFDYVNTIVRDSSTQSSRQKAASLYLTANSKKRKELSPKQMEGSFSSRRGFVDSRTSSRLLHDLRSEKKTEEDANATSTAVVVAHSQQLESRSSPRSQRSTKSKRSFSTPAFLIPANIAIESLLPLPSSPVNKRPESLNHPHASSTPSTSRRPNSSHAKFVSPYSTNQIKWGPSGRETNRSSFLSGRVVAGQPTELKNDASYGGLVNMVLAASKGPDIRPEKLLSFRPSFGLAKRFEGSGEEMCTPGPKYDTADYLEPSVSGSTAYSFGKAQPNRDLFIHGYQRNDLQMRKDENLVVGPSSYSPLASLPHASNKPQAPQLSWAKSKVDRFAPKADEKWRSPGPQYYPHVAQRRELPRTTLGPPEGTSSFDYLKNFGNIEEKIAQNEKSAAGDERGGVLREGAIYMSPSALRKAKLEALVAGRSTQVLTHEKAQTIAKLASQAQTSRTDIDLMQKSRKGLKLNTPSMFKRRDPPSQFIGTHQVLPGVASPGPRYHTPFKWDAKKAKEQFIPVAPGWH